MAISKFKIRASALGKIMAGAVGIPDAQQKEIDTLTEKKNKPIGLTVNQEKELILLQSKENLTEKQQIKLDALKNN